VTGTRRRRRNQLLDDLEKKAKILAFERGSTSSHCLGELA